MFTEERIISRIPEILSWTKAAKKMSNEYLWGGTIGPNFDCSGLVQSAFASSGIWIPRDAFQQEKFCTNISLDIEALGKELKLVIYFSLDHLKNVPTLDYTLIMVFIFIVLG